MADEYVYEQGQKVNEMYFIEDGFVQITEYHITYKNERIEHQGGHFGEMAILTKWTSDSDALC